MKFGLKQHNENLTACFNLHQRVFPKYKNRHRKDEIVVLGSGPSLNYYQYDKSKIHIGCNRLFRTMDLDYLFIIDAVGTREYLNELLSFNKEKCKIFIGKHLVDMNYTDSSFWFNQMEISDSFSSANRAERFYSVSASGFARFLYPDIDLFPLADFRSIIHAAFQFALFAGSKKIYIVGCDSQLNGYYDGTQQDLKWTNDAYSHVIEGWKKFKKFADVYYPDTEIISLNPVGLRGIFKDVYTRQYVYDHPELLREDIEIMD